MQHRKHPDRNGTHDLGERVQILMELGLTFLQAQTYLALCQTGTATVKTIYNASNIARQDIYRIMPTLQELGLAEKILSAPTMYKPTPAKEGYNILLQNKTNEHIDLQNKTKKLIKNLNGNNNKTTLQNKDTQFVITTSKNLLWKRFHEGIDRTQKSLDVSGKCDGMCLVFFNNLSHIKRALKRGVRIRIITEKKTDKRMQKIIQPLKKNPLFEIGYRPMTSPIDMMINDEKEVSLCLSPPTDNTGLPSLWTNNPQSIKIVTNYFEELWTKSSN